MALWESHDSVLVDVRGESAVFVVRRVRTNEAVISFLSFALLGWITFLVARGYLLYLILTALLVAAGVAVTRAFRIRIETSGERVLVFNYWRTFEFTWAEVKDVGVGAVTQGALPVPALAFGLSNGKIVCAQATPRNHAQRQKLARELALRAPSSVAWRPDLLSRE